MTIEFSPLLYQTHHHSTQHNHDTRPPLIKQSPSQRRRARLKSDSDAVQTLLLHHRLDWLTRACTARAIARSLAAHSLSVHDALMSYDADADGRLSAAELMALALGVGAAKHPDQSQGAPALTAAAVSVTVVCHSDRQGAMRYPQLVSLLESGGVGLRFEAEHDCHAVCDGLPRDAALAAARTHESELHALVRARVEAVDDGEAVRAALEEEEQRMVAAAAEAKAREEAQKTDPDEEKPATEANLNSFGWREWEGPLQAVYDVGYGCKVIDFTLGTIPSVIRVVGDVELRRDMRGVSFLHADPYSGFALAPVGSRSRTGTMAMVAKVSLPAHGSSRNNNAGASVAGSGSACVSVEDVWRARETVRRAYHVLLGASRERWASLSSSGRAELVTYDHFLEVCMPASEEELVQCSASTAPPLAQSVWAEYVRTREAYSATSSGATRLVGSAVDKSQYPQGDYRMMFCSEAPSSHPLGTHARSSTMSLSQQQMSGQWLDQAITGVDYHKWAHFCCSWADTATDMLAGDLIQNDMAALTIDWTRPTNFFMSSDYKLCATRAAVRFIVYSSVSRVPIRNAGKLLSALSVASAWPCEACGAANLDDTGTGTCCGSCGWAVEPAVLTEGLEVCPDCIRERSTKQRAVKREGVMVRVCTECETLLLSGDALSTWRAQMRADRHTQMQDWRRHKGLCSGVRAWLGPQATAGDGLDDEALLDAVVAKRKDTLARSRQYCSKKVWADMCRKKGKAEKASMEGKDTEIHLFTFLEAYGLPVVRAAQGEADAEEEEGEEEGEEDEEEEEEEDDDDEY